jgi:hypothetical protein
MRVWLFRDVMGRFPHNFDWRFVGYVAVHPDNKGEEIGLEGKVLELERFCGHNGTWTSIISNDHVHYLREELMPTAVTSRVRNLCLT